MLEEVVAQVEFNFPRDADQNPAGQELEDSLGQSYADQQQGIDHQLVIGDSVAEAVDGSLDYFGEENPGAVVQEDAEGS